MLGAAFIVPDPDRLRTGPEELQSYPVTLRRMPFNPRSRIVAVQAMGTKP